jgi:hypothetical protein
MSAYIIQDVWNTWKWKWKIIFLEFHLTRYYPFTNGALVPIRHILTILWLIVFRKIWKVSSVFSLSLIFPPIWTIFQIHFGVNSGASRFALETQAVNEATFRCPDELGWKPQVCVVVWLHTFHYLHLFLVALSFISFIVDIAESPYCANWWKHLTDKGGKDQNVFILKYS